MSLFVNKILHTDSTETTPVEIPSLDRRMATAWAVWNCKGIISVLDSEDVVTVTDTGVGSFDVKVKAGIDVRRAAINLTFDSVVNFQKAVGYTLIDESTVRVRTSAAGGYVDPVAVCITIFGGK